MRWTKNNSSLLQSGASSQNGSQRKGSFQNSPSPNSHPDNSGRKNSASKSLKKQNKSKVIKKWDPNMYIKTSGGYKKKLIVKSIAFTNKDIKYSEKEISSEGSDNWEKLITYNKWLSTPLNLNLNTKFDRNMNIPIKQSNLDDSVSEGSDWDIIIPKISGITSNKLHQLSTNSNKWMSANALSPERVVFTQTNSPG